MVYSNQPEYSLPSRKGIANNFCNITHDKEKEGLQILRNKTITLACLKWLVKYS